MTGRHHPRPTAPIPAPTENTMTTDSFAQQITPDTPAWRRWRLARGLDQYDTDAGPLLTNLSRRERRAPGRAGAPARAGEPGRGLINAGMALLGLLDAGLLYVVYAAQYAFIFSQKHEHTAAQVQALALDAAMIIFSVLALGLARKGLGAPAERAAIVACAAASAFMNWTAADQASLRSVAVYVAAPILLALTTDRTISVVRRHVLGMKDDAQPVGAHGPRPGPLQPVRAPRRGGLQGDPRGASRHAILAAAPLPEAEPAALAEDQDALGVLRADLATGLERIRSAAEADLAGLRGRLEFTSSAVDGAMTGLQGITDRLGRLELAAGASAYPTKKAHFMALYREHADYGAARPPAGWPASWPPGPGSRPGPPAPTSTEELAAWPARQEGGQVKTADVLLTLPFHHLYLDALGVLVLAALFWRFNLSHWAMESNRARAMRWRTRCHLRPGPGFATLAELVYQWGRLAASKRGGRARPGLAYRQRLLARPRHYAIRLGRAQWGKRVLGTMEANWLLLAPPRKGKSGALADWILDWPGAVIATSTRADLFMNTAGARCAPGRGPRVQPVRYRQRPVHLRVGPGGRVPGPSRGVHPGRRADRPARGRQR